MNYSNYRITLEVQDSGSNTVLTAKRGDTGRKLYVTLTDGGLPYRLTEDCMVVFTARKPDGHVVFNHCAKESNTVVYNITEQTLAAAGLANCEIRVYAQDGMLLTSASFSLLVEVPVYNDGDEIESTDEFNALTKLLTELQDLKKELEDLIASGGGGGGGGAPGKDGKNGATFTPSVDVSGNLSWSNDGGLPNPSPVNIKGEKGDPGEKGDQGEPGKNGATVQEVLEELPMVTAMDFSGFASGSFAEVVDGKTVNHAVTFDEAGRPSKIDDVVIKWG